MFKRIIKVIFHMIYVLIIGALLIVGLPRLITEVIAFPRIHTIENSPSARVGIVFGAGLNRDGTATPVLKHRVIAAAELFHAGKIQKILMSGDNSSFDHNEPAAMLDYAISLGVPREDIVLDYAGRRTYDTCYRAIHIFGVQDALLITQRFHLPRALFTCNMLGLASQGINANLAIYRNTSRLVWNIREVPATLVAFWETLITKPQPVLGNPEPIFPDADLSEDHPGQNSA
jgi:SanA protein